MKEQIDALVATLKALPPLERIGVLLAILDRLDQLAVPEDPNPNSN